jgi:cystathionine beta-lyase/cystathionine gamma-synthase
MHSATKYLAGHSDVMAGFDYEGGRLRYTKFSTICYGAILGPGCFLVLRGKNIAFKNAKTL